MINVILIQGLPVHGRDMFEIDSQKIQVVPEKKHKYINMFIDCELTSFFHICRPVSLS